jgi:hypothetical protein
MGGQGGGKNSLRRNNEATSLLDFILLKDAGKLGGSKLLDSLVYQGEWDVAFPLVRNQKSAGMLTPSSWHAISSLARASQETSTQRPRQMRRSFWGGFSYPGVWPAPVS